VIFNVAGRPAGVPELLMPNLGWLAPAGFEREFLSAMDAPPVWAAIVVAYCLGEFTDRRVGWSASAMVFLTTAIVLAPFGG
jgi:hypothetical protein